MLKISDLSLPLSYQEQDLKRAAAKRLGIPCSEITWIRLSKRSVDARKKDRIHFICTVEVNIKRGEAQVLKQNQKNKVSLAVPYCYSLPTVSRKLEQRPVVVGCGPAGLFAALILALAGLEPILLERGRDVDRRTQDVRRFWETGTLDPSSNVQFGEGGAGTFSDGKLNTGTKDSRSRKVLEEFVACGAPREILYTAKPHIGTDHLRTTVKNLRKKMIALGGEVRFESLVTGWKEKNGCLTGLFVQSKDCSYELETQDVILAIGHSARDTFTALYENKIPLEPKAFSLGARIEHLQKQIDRSQYGSFAGHPALGAADYKLSVHLSNGRGVYTFCMCPGGSVVAAASEPGRLVTNGMSEFARNLPNANSALLVGITPEDFPSSHPLSGMYLQRQLEEQAFRLGGETYAAPVQRVEDFLKNRPSTHFGEILPTYRPGAIPSNLSECLPEFICESMRMGIVALEKKLPGFSHPDALLTGVETRSSSPIRILRDPITLQSLGVSGLYPCGEGAGYAGGIISAAVDGIRCAEALISRK